jgi:hypothetical protein
MLKYLVLSLFVVSLLLTSCYQYKKEDLIKYIKAENVKAVKHLIKKGADVNKPEIQGGWSPLHYAAQYGNAEIVKVLLDAGANPNYSGSANLEDSVVINTTPLTVAGTCKTIIENPTMFTYAKFADPVLDKRLRDPKSIKLYEEVYKLLDPVTNGPK